MNNEFTECIDELPENEEPVLLVAYDAHGEKYFIAGCCISDYDREKFFTSTMQPIYDVVAWQPLPEMP